MKDTEFYFPSGSGLGRIHVNQWTPDRGPVRAVIQIAHGIAEYGRRYQDIAEFLTRQGYAVLAGDHLGHGKSAYPENTATYFGKSGGWWYAVEDMELLRQRIVRDFPGAPVILFGHSMGSFLSRSHLICHPGAYDACILSGTGYPGAAVIWAGKLVCRLKRIRMEPSDYSAFVDRMAFGGYNKKFAPNRTGSDWLSLDEDNVDAYLADPLCGVPAKLGIFSDLMEGLGHITKVQNIRKMDPSVPILLISGAQDPVGDMGRGVLKTRDRFREAGIDDVTAQLYPGLRHEILNEACRREIYGDVLDWLCQRFS